MANSISRQKGCNVNCISREEKKEVKGGQNVQCRSASKQIVLKGSPKSKQGNFTFLPELWPLGLPEHLPDEEKVIRFVYK